MTLPPAGHIPADRPHLFGQALTAAIAHDDHGLTATLEALTPAELYTLANAASRLRRQCEAVHNGGQGEAPHHGRTRWEFKA